MKKTILKKMTVAIVTVAALVAWVISQNGVYGQNAFAATQDTSNGHDSDCNQAGPGHADQNQPCSGSGDTGSDNSNEQ
jgi:hypothetical protein